MKKKMYIKTCGVSAYLSSHMYYGLSVFVLFVWSLLKK